MSDGPAAGTQAKTAVERSRLAASRFRAAGRAMDVLHHLIPGDPDVRKLEVQHAAQQAAFSTLLMTDPEHPVFEKLVWDVEQNVTQVERNTLLLDGEIPMAWMRERFDASALTPESIVDYAAMLGGSLADNPARLDRIEFVLTRMVAVALPAGAAASARDLESLFHDAFPPADIEARVRDAAVQFFAAAAARVAAFTSVKQLFDAGIFVDVRGYKLALKSALLDPDIIAAAIDTNRTMTRRIRELVAEGRSDADDVERYMAETNGRIQDIFQSLRADETPVLARFARRLPQLKQSAAAKQAATFEQFLKQGKQRRKDPAKTRRFLLVLAVVLVSLLAIMRAGGGTRMEDMPLARVHSISPVLERAAVSAGRRRLLMGYVDKSRWTLLSAAQRQQVAAAIAVETDALGYEATTLLLEGRVVGQLEGGKVLLVE